MSLLKKVAKAFTPDPQKKLDARGYEIPDPTKLSIPAGFKRPETLAEQVARVVRKQISDEAAANGDETFDESEDFEIGDEFDPLSPYEEVFDPSLGRSITPDEMRRNHHLYRERYLTEANNYEQWLSHMEELKNIRARDAETRRSRGAGAPAPASTASQSQGDKKEGSST